MNFISFLQAVILGAVQGVTEFLPVSSTGHLVILEHFFHLDPNQYGLSFDMFINLGTTLAVTWYFRHDLLSIFRKLRFPNGKPYTKEEKLPWWILGVTALVGIAGLLLEKHIDSTLRTLPIIITMLIVFGAFMLLAEKLGKQKSTELSGTQAYLVGLSQILAFVPGVSRSGSTISSGLFLGLTRETAARYSFLLSVPVTLAAILKRLATTASDVQQNGIAAETAMFYIVGLIVSTIVGYYTVHFLLEYLRKYSLAAFAYYRFGLAAILIVYLVLR